LFGGRGLPCRGSETRQIARSRSCGGSANVRSDRLRGRQADNGGEGMHATFGYALRSIVFLAMVLGPPAYAGPLYKCEVNGTIAFQDRPCVAANQKVACIQGDHPQIQYADELTEPCTPARAESFSSGYSGSSYFYSGGSAGYEGRSGYGRGSADGHGASFAGTDVTVRGYTRANGTHVQGHTRSAPGRGRGR